MIDYALIGEAVNYYTSLGYEYIEVPWAVGDWAYNVTKPPGARDMKNFMGNLVASGEQSFLEMMAQDGLKPGQYQCVTPCFRDEAVESEFTRLWFLKLELIDIEPRNPETSLLKMLGDAAVFMARHVLIKPVQTDYGFDLMSGEIELGSYGYREVVPYKWVYGTGLAEPRFSLAKSKYHSGLKPMTT